MVALTEAGVIALVTAALTAVTAVLVAIIGAQANHRSKQARVDREELARSVKPENGHATLGAGLAAVEERQIVLDERLDRIEVKQAETLQLVAEDRGLMRAVAERLDRHLVEVDPLIADALKKKRGDKRG